MRLHRWFVLAAGLLMGCLATPVTGPAHEIKIGSLVVFHPWFREAPGGEADGFMKIANHGAEDERLIGVTADIAGKVILCDMKSEGGSLKMVELPQGILLPAGKTVEFSSKSLHLMLRNIKSSPLAGTEFGGTLNFERAGSLRVDFEVEEPLQQ